MNGTQCPKCGSDQVLNDQCLKCGIVVSRYRSAGSSGGAPTGSTGATAPVSFVAAPSPNQLPDPGYTIPASVIEREQLQKKRLQQKIIVTAGIVILLLIAGNLLYKFFILRASHYAGLYKNGTMLFSLKFPQADSEWYHYPEGRPDSPLYKGAKDAFHRGKDADDPEITIGVWNENIRPVPEKMDAGTADRMISESEDALLQIMVDRGIDCTITKSGMARPGDNDGFRMEADIQVDGKPMKLIAVRAHNVNLGYWFFVSGSEEAMNANSEEVNGLLGSISFRMSVI